LFEKIIYRYPSEKSQIWSRIEKHYKLFDRSLIANCQDIFSAVEKEGDTAIYKATAIHDNVAVESLKADDKYVDQCVNALSPELRAAIEKAIQNISQVNEILKPEEFWQKEIRPGTIIGEKCTPLSSVGLWVPARKGPLVSTALMLTVAAKVAGVKRIVVGMSPRVCGKGDAATIAAAKLAGADEFVTGNGVGIIAGFSIGTESVPEVDGIYGPGPNAIAAAMSVAFSYGKRTVVGIGPTEGAIIADESADAKTLAYDMISESEHGPDSSFLLVTHSGKLALEVTEELKKLIDSVVQPRKDNLLSVFGPKGFGAIVITDTIESSIEVVNEYAPEHLMIWCNSGNEEKTLKDIQNTGEILIGPHTTFSAANYLIGITAVLPTNGFSKRFSGITCKDMLKFSSYAKITEAAIQDLYPGIKAIGEYEGLPCHVKAAEMRMYEEVVWARWQNICEGAS
jgi:histidinol dehydrogenase